MNKPIEISKKLQDAGMTEDQANSIAADLYQPIKRELEIIKNVTSKLIAWSENELGRGNACTLIDELNNQYN